MRFHDPRSTALLFGAACLTAFCVHAEAGVREAYNRGTETLLREDYAAAQRQLLEALAAAPTELRGRIAYNLGNAYARAAQHRASAKERAEDLEKARHYYKLALRETPSDADAKHNLEWALAQLAHEGVTPEGEQSDGGQAEEGDGDPQTSEAGGEESEGRQADAAEPGDTPQPAGEGLSETESHNGEGEEDSGGAEEGPADSGPEAEDSEQTDGVQPKEAVDRGTEDAHNRGEAASGESEFSDVEQALPGVRPDTDEAGEDRPEEPGSETADAGRGEQQQDPQETEPGALPHEPHQELPGEAAELDPEAEGDDPAMQRRIEFDPESGELWLLDAMRESEKVYMRPLDPKQAPQPSGNNW